MVTYIQTRRARRRRRMKMAAVHLKRGAPLFLGASINIVPNTSNKTGMKSLPRSLCCFWLKHYFFVMFLFMVLININAAFVFLFVFKGVVLHFHASGVPFLYLFYPTNIFVKQKFSYFCISFFFFSCSCGKLDCKLFVNWKTSFFCSFVTCSCIGDKGGEWAVIAVRVSSFQFLITKNANEGVEGRWEFSPLSLSSPFFFIFFFSLKK